jgi:glycosyltransferase involved in cell wall biosynthesis
MEERLPKRVALLATHPIQYQIPWFCRLAASPELDLKVFFGLVPDAAQQGVGFDISFSWDIPLLEGYAWSALKNVSNRPSLGSFTGCNTPEIYRELRSWCPHVVILTGWHSLMMFQGLWACKRLRIKAVVRGESNALRSRPWFVRVGHRLLMKGYTSFLAVGEANRVFYEQAGVSANRIFDCPYFVDNDRFVASAAELNRRRSQLRSRWQIPDEACCFVFVGKMLPKKRPLDLLFAVDEARKQCASLHLLMVGTGQLMDEAKAFAAKQNLPVTFTGFLNQSEIPKAYVAADCLVLPSDSGETWGLVVNEAMACGIPAIVSDRVGCGPDLVVAEETGAIFPLGNVDSLARKIVSFASDMDRLKAMGKEAQKKVMTCYSVGRAVDGTLAAVQAAVRT